MSRAPLTLLDSSLTRVARFSLRAVVRLVTICLAMLTLHGMAGRTEAASCTDLLLPRGGTYRCTATFDSLTQQTYCLERRADTADPNDVAFHTGTATPGSTSAFEQTCTCAATGKGLKAKFAHSTTFMCLDEGTSTVSFGKIAKKKMSGQTYNVSVKLRSIFTCVADPTCNVCNPAGAPCTTAADCCTGMGLGCFIEPNVPGFCKFG